MTDTLTGTPQEKEFAAAVRATPPGMAFTIGSGPTGKTCRGCSFWDHDGKPQYFALGGKYGGEIKPSPCAMYRRLSAGQEGTPVEHWNDACKYFQENPSPPPLRKKVGLYWHHIKEPK
jgi:hypothetical protein